MYVYVHECHVEGSYGCSVASSVQTCFVRSLSTEAGHVPPDVDYPLSPKYTLMIDGHTRWVAMV